MKIACLGWGSLIWDPKSLLIRRTWFRDGPFIQVEFVRQSKDGRLTLVICDSAKPVRSLWALMATDDINVARTSLLEREGIPKNKIDSFIGSVTSIEETEDEFKLTVKQWLNSINLDAAIWTNLPPKFNGENDKVPSIEEACDYFNSIDINAKTNAENYIRRTPIQIDTEFRRKFEQEFNWTAIV